MQIKITHKVPRMTSQFDVCPIPYRLDTYSGCVFGCKYCFARDITQTSRRANNLSTEECNFKRLAGLNVKALDKWIKNTMIKETNNIHRIAFKERIPVKIGGLADPFPPCEQKNRITHDTLMLLHRIDYPVQISTKNPRVLAEYAHDFVNPNWVVSITIITPDESLRAAIEPGAPSINERLEAASKLAEMNIPVLIRIQPVIYPYIMGKMENLLEIIYKSRAKGIIMEGLKIKIAMCEYEKLLYQEMSEQIGYDLRQWYKDNGVRIRSDYELRKEDKLKYIDLAKQICNNFGLLLYIGDNNCRAQSCSKECCGTEILRNHKNIFQSEKLQECVVNFGRSKKYLQRTLREILNTPNWVIESDEKEIN